MLGGPWGLSTKTALYFWGDHCIARADVRHETAKSSPSCTYIRCVKPDFSYKTEIIDKKGQTVY